VNCPRCTNSKAYPVQPVEIDGEPGVELACSNCGTFRKRKAELEPT
jgi:uncharacterized Zn finger protein